MTALDIEEAIYRAFGIRQNIIVPNIYWGLGLYHECDMLVCNKKSRYCAEVEIKISKSDILADKKKKHGHRDERIARLFFAVPESLREYALANIPEQAGLIIVGDEYLSSPKIRRVQRVRNPKRNKDSRKLTEAEYCKLIELGCMRLHTMTKKNIKLRDGK